MSKSKYRYGKFEQHRVQSVYGKDITIGMATVKHTESKGVRGWVIPGGKFISCPFKAKAVAQEMNRIINANGGLPAWSAKHAKAAA